MTVTQSISELVVDARGAEVGSAAYVRAMDAAQRAVDRTIDRQVALDQAMAKQTTTMVGGAATITRTAAAWDRLRSSIDPVAAAEIRARRAVEQATVAADNAVRRGLTTEVQAAEVLQRIRAQQVVELDRVREAQQRVTTAQRETAQVSQQRAANDNNSFGTFTPSANLAAQFQDIFVTSQMGMNPLQIALQQGTQISAVFGGMGAAGAVKALGAAFASIISPISLFTIAAVAAAAMAIQWIGGLLQETPKAEDALEEHLKWVDRITAGYDTAQKAAKGVVDEAQKLPQAAVVSELEAGQKENLEAVAKQFQELVALRQMWDAMGPMGRANGVPPDVVASIEATAAALRDVAADGQITADEAATLVTTFTRLKNESPDKNIRELAAEALAVATNFRAATAEVDSTAASLSALSGISIPDWMKGHGGLLGVGDAVKSLTKMTPENRTVREQGDAIFAEAVGQARTTSEIDVLTAAHQKLNQELTRQEEIKATARAARGDSPEEKFDVQMAQTEAQIAALELQNESFGKSTFEVERLAAALDLKTAAEKAGLEISPEVQANIDALASRFANAKLEAEGLQLTLQNQTPFEQLGEQVARLDELFSHGAITADVYARAIGSATANAATTTLGALANLSSGLSQAFEDNKVLAIATAVLKGAEAVASAYAAGNAVFGPVGGAAFAAIAAVTAAANVAAVSGVTKSSKSMPGTSGGGSGAALTPVAPSATQSRTINVVLPAGQQMFSRAQIEALVRELNDASVDGISVNQAA